MQIQIGLALSVFKDPQPQKLLDHFVGNLSGICFGHADQYQKTFADAACYLSIYFYLCMLYPLYYKSHLSTSLLRFSLLDLFILAEISLIFKLMILLQSGIQCMESLFINIFR